MGIFESLLGGGSDPYDIYGDLFTPQQKAALRDRDMGQGLLRMAGAFAEAGMPSRLPVPLGAALGKAAQAFGAGGDENAERMLKGMQTAEAVRESRSTRALQGQISPIMLAILEKKLGVPPGTFGGPKGGLLTGAAAPAAAPAGPAAPSAPVTPAAPAVPQAGAPNAADYGGGGGSPGVGGDFPGAVPPQQTGLLGAPPPQDQVLRELASYMVSPENTTFGGAANPFAGLLAAASYGSSRPGPGLLGGAAPGMPPFGLSAARPGAAGPDLSDAALASDAGGGGDDVLDTVVAPLESGNRNILQQVVPRNVSTAGGYYQITDSTWKDTAPKAGVSLADYPTALSAPREVQKAVAEQLRSERGLQPWADFNPAVAKAIGWQGRSERGEKPADVVLPSGEGGALSAINALLDLSSGGAASPFRLATADLAPYAIGNAVLGGKSSVEGVSPEMSRRIQTAVEAMPPELRERFKIISGYRDAARQQQVNPDVTYSQHGSGTGPPGTGRAVDLAKDPAVLDWITRNPQYGLGFPLASDPREINHLEMIDPASGARLAQVLDGERRINVEPLGGAAVPAGGTAPGGGVGGLGIDPEALAALNALTKMGKLGTPFDSLLETYYKSPGYLGEKTAAETKARTDIEDPLNQRMKVLEMALDMRKNGILYNPQTGEIKADPEWDKIHGRRAEDTKILELDYAKKLKVFEEQQKIAEEIRKDQKEIAPQPIYKGGMIVEQPMTREAAVARLKDQSMRPGEYRDGDIVAKPIGNLSPDHQYKMSPTGGLTVEPIAGTPGAEKAAAAAKAKDISDRQLLVSRDIVVQDADRLENLIKTSPVPVTGMLGSLLSNMPGTPQGNARALIDGLKARASIDAINRARAATGSTGLGQITMGEHALLANAIANLEQSQTEGQLLFNLRRFKQEYIDAVHGPGAYSKLLPDTPVVKTPSSAPAGTAATAPADAAQLRSEAADAIKAGKSRSAVIKRLQDMGVDAGGL